MNTTNPLRVLLGFSLLGVLFSGYLTYQRYFGPPGCAQGFFSCSGNGRAVLIFGQPTCIYGLAMFVIVTILTLLALRSRQPKGLINGVFALGWLGVLFSLGVVFYELWGIKLSVTQLPACVYGFFIFLGILISAWAARARMGTPSTLTPPATTPPPPATA